MTIEPGMIIDLGPEQWEYGDGPVRLLVTRVLDHLSRYYDGKKVWIEGVRLDDAGRHLEHLEILVRNDALPR